MAEERRSRGKGVTSRLALCTFVQWGHQRAAEETLHREQANANPKPSLPVASLSTYTLTDEVSFLKVLFAT